MGLTSLDSNGITPFDGSEGEFSLWSLTVEAHLLAHGVTLSEATTATTASTASTATVTTAPVPAPSVTASSTAAATTTSTPGSLSIEEDAALFTFLVKILRGHPLQIAITDNPNRSGVLVLQRLRERYEPTGQEHILHLQQQLNQLSYGPSDNIDTFMQRVIGLDADLRLRGVHTELHEIMRHIMRALPADFHLPLRLALRESPPPSLRQLSSMLLEEQRLIATKQTSAAFVASSAQPQHQHQRRHFEPQQQPARSQQACCPPRNKLTCRFCSIKGHCAQNCFKLSAAIKHGVIDIQTVLHTLRQHSKRDSGSSSSSSSSSTRVHNKLNYQPRSFTVTTSPGTMQPAPTCFQPWLADSGASQHMTADRQAMTAFRWAAIPVQLANGSTVQAEGTGTVELRVRDTSGSLVDLALTEVLYVPGIVHNLLALSRVARAGGSVSMARDSTTIAIRGVDIPLRNDNHGHSYLDIASVCKESPSHATLAFSTTTSAPTKDQHDHQHDQQQQQQHDQQQQQQQLHSVLGHRNDADVQLVMQQIAKNQSRLCEVCELAKSTRKSVPKASAPRTADVCKLLYADILGPLEVESIQHYKYVLSFIDDNTRYAWSFLLKRKSDAPATVSMLVRSRHFVTHDDPQPIVLQTDSDQVFKAATFGDTCALYNIRQRFAPPHTQSNNGAIERFFRTLTNTVRSLLIGASLPKGFWGFAAKHATTLYNISPRRSLDSAAPFTKLTGHQFPISKLQVFGAPAFVHTEKGAQRRKLDPRARRGIYVGFSEADRAHLVYLPDTGRLINTIHVRFGALKPTDDSKQMCRPPVQLRLQWPTTRHQSPTASDSPRGASASKANAVGPSDHLGHPDDQQPPEVVATSDDTATAHALPNDNGNSTTVSSSDPAVADDELDTTDDESSVVVDGHHSHAQGDSNDSLHAEDDPLLTSFVASAAETASGAGEKKYKTTPRSSSGHAEPQTVAEAMASDEAEEWTSAINEELSAMERNHVFDVVPADSIPPGTSCVKSMLIFKRKRDAHGNVTKYKARLVARGFSQVKGINYSETFAPTASVTAIRHVLATATSRGMAICQMDVSTAFLNADIDHNIYMAPPPGAHVFPKGCRLKLRKSIYGLKQSPHLWNNTLHDFMVSQQLTSTQTDACIYHRVTSPDTHLWVIVYVDDLLLCADRDADLCEFKTAIQGRFSMKDLGSPQLCLGMQVEYDRRSRTLSLCQSHYIAQVLADFGMSDCKAVRTPLSTGYTDKPCGPGDETPDVPFRELIGSALYAASMTRPDIATAVSVLCRHMKAWTQDHWVAAKHLLRYLRGTMQHKITYSGSAPDNGTLVGYADASYASDIATGRSRTGFVLLRSNGPVAWSSKLQGTVATATAEAEYMSLSAAVQEVVFLRQLEQELLGVDSLPPTTLFTDNQPALQVARSSSTRMRHIRVRYHYIRECVKQDVVHVEYCPTNDMLADIMTKILARAKTEQFCRILFAAE